jgi:hypothetical protein
MKTYKMTLTYYTNAKSIDEVDMSDLDNGDYFIEEVEYDETLNPIDE